MKKLLASTCLVFGLLGGASASNAADCGSPTIASMNWQSAEVLSAIDKIILNEGYGCSADITIGDTVPTITSMVEKGQPDIAPEAWADTLPEVVKRGVDEGKLVVAATALPDGGIQGWWIPKYVADAHPDIKTIGDLLKNPKLFPDAENPEKGAIVNGPQGWAAPSSRPSFTRHSARKKRVSPSWIAALPLVSTAPLPRLTSASSHGSAITGRPPPFSANTKW